LAFFGKLNSLRSFLRISASMASCSVRETSRMRTRVGSVRPPAAPTVSNGSLRRRHHAIVSTLTRKLSQASITRSNPRSSSSAMLDTVRNACTASTPMSGLIARQRSAIASALLRP